VGALVFVAVTEDKPLNLNWFVLIAVTEDKTLALNWYVFIAGAIFIAIIGTLILGTISWLLASPKVFKVSNAIELAKALKESDSSNDNSGSSWD